MMAGSTDVLICGAGAAGLTMAIDLARRGVRFVLIDKLPSSFQGSRGKGIQPRTQEIFEDLGILDRAMAAMEAELAQATIAEVAADVARLGKFTIPLKWA